jgi:hypothetical protein
MSLLKQEARTLLIALTDKNKDGLTRQRDPGGRTAPLSSVATFPLDIISTPLQLSGFILHNTDKRICLKEEACHDEILYKFDNKSKKSA